MLVRQVTCDSFCDIRARLVSVLWSCASSDSIYTQYTDKDARRHLFHNLLLLSQLLQCYQIILLNGQRAVTLFGCA